MQRCILAIWIGAMRWRNRVMCRSHSTNRSYTILSDRTLCPPCRSTGRIYMAITDTFHCCRRDYFGKQNPRKVTEVLRGAILMSTY